MILRGLHAKEKIRTCSLGQGMAGNLFPVVQQLGAKSCWMCRCETTTISSTMSIMLDGRGKIDNADSKCKDGQGYRGIQVDVH